MMNLVKKQQAWDPFDVMEDLQSDLNRVFNRSLSRQGWGQPFRPDIEVREEENRFLVHADLPGMKKEDIEISVEGTQLTLKGERKEEKERKEKGYQYTERSFGSFVRVIQLSSEVEAEKVAASYKDGVLEIALPKAESARKKQIKVQ